jgi:predicted glycoside hydrolase/deacetylase ChbG (UPF0249 family)
MVKFMLGVCLYLLSQCILFSQDSYASKLGYKSTDKVIILHVDDVGMSYESNHGAIDALEKGVARSWSIMMPCPWVPEIFHYLKKHPLTDAGLHLTLTSEWKEYRWEPLAGANIVPGLIDHEGAMHSNVADVVKQASAEEVYLEIKAQLARSRKMNWEPTHLDSHMGTLFAQPAFLSKYLQLGKEEHIPLMFPGGHNTLMMKSNPVDEKTLQFMREEGKKLWESGLPVIDDLHNLSYGWKPNANLKSAKEIRKYKTLKYIESFKELRPGITFVIMHCAISSEIFPHITDSGGIRRGDLETMMDPDFKKFLTKEGIIVTTFRDLSERRKNANY